MGAVGLQFLGSMNLAITLLVAISIASIIGTVLRQAEPYQNYIIKFGPFWFEVFQALGLYDVYGALWFLAILGFLLVSTAVCVYRNGPVMLRDMRHFRENVTANSLRAFHHQTQLSTGLSSTDAVQRIAQTMRARGFRLRLKERDGQSVLVAMKGSFNRLGYLFTHVAIVIICVGALLDGNLPLKLAEWTGKVRVETRDIPANQVPETSVLGPDNRAFRGSVSIPEGASASIVFLNVRDGYLVQELPFRVELSDFRIEHYPSGQPKSFESDLIIHDPQLGEPLRQTIAVNHPLAYRGYTIYQASFGDGGSTLRMTTWPLRDPQRRTVELEGKIDDDLQLQSADGVLTIELGDFRPFNVNPDDNPDSKRQFKNLGPSFTFKVRRPSGEAVEYLNYMAPIEQEGRLFLISGMRTSPADDFRYLHIPADPRGSPERFINLLSRLHDSATLERVAAETVADIASGSDQFDETTSKNIAATVQRLLTMFADSGFDGLNEHIETNVPEQEREAAGSAYLRMLRMALGRIYLPLLEEEGRALAEGVAPEDTQFFDDAITAIAQLPYYATPFYLQLRDFEHRQSSGLQITRAPGKDIVYLGCVLLICGIFMMFYIHHRRYWAMVDTTADGAQVLFAGAGNRNRRDFGLEFDAAAAEVAAALDSMQDPKQ